jgi:hypothetical protein
MAIDEAPIAIGSQLTSGFFVIPKSMVEQFEPPEA